MAAPRLFVEGLFILLYTSHTMALPITSQFTDFIRHISWSNPTWDLFIVVFLLVGTLIYGFSLGRDRIIMIMVAVYIALVASSHLPYVPNFGSSVASSNGFIIKMSAFLGLFTVLFFMLTRSALNHAIAGSGALGSWWHVLILAFLQVGMLVSVVLSFLPQEWLSHLSQFTQTVFASPWGKFTWVVLPIFGLLIVGISTDRSSGRNYD